MAHQPISTEKESQLKSYTTPKPDIPGFLEFYQKYNLAMNLDGVPEILQKHNLEGM